MGTNGESKYMLDVNMTKQEYLLKGPCIYTISGILNNLERDYQISKHHLISQREN